MWVQKLSGGGVEGVVFSPDGRTLYTADGGGGYTAWDTAARTADHLYRLGVYERGVVYELHIAGNGRYLVAVKHPLFVWDLVERRAVPGLATDQPPIVAVWPGPELRLVAPSADRLHLVVQDQGTVYGPHPTVIRAYDLSPDARTLAVVSINSREVSLMGVGVPRDTRSFVVPTEAASVWGVRFSPDGGTLAVFTGLTVQLWDVATLTRRSGPVVINNRRNAFAFHPRLPLFTAKDGDGEFTLFSSDTGAAVRTLDFGLGRRVQCVAFSPDGLTCAVGGSNRQFAVFDVDD